LLTGPDDNQPAGASDWHGPFNAAWYADEEGLNPLSGPSWFGLPFGLGNFGTPCARMHSAKATLKPPVVLLPDWPPDPKPERVTGPAPVAWASAVLGGLLDELLPHAPTRNVLASAASVSATRPRRGRYRWPGGCLSWGDRAAGLGLIVGPSTG
jgi:hypothetical protein